MVKRLGIVAFGLLLVVSGPLAGQQTERREPAPVGGLTLPSRSVVLVVGSQRLFSETLFGQRLEDETQADSDELRRENRRIEAELAAEELKLDGLRRSVGTEEFRELADAFDAKVQRIRRERTEQARILERRVNTRRRAFEQTILPILGQIMTEAGAAVIMERDSVVLLKNTVDITDLAIHRINSVLGDGSDASQP